MEDEKRLRAKVVDGQLTKEEELLADPKDVRKAKEYKEWRKSVHDANKRLKEQSADSSKQVATKQTAISDFFSHNKWFCFFDKTLHTLLHISERTFCLVTA